MLRSVIIGRFDMTVSGFMCQLPIARCHILVCFPKFALSLWCRTNETAGQTTKRSCKVRTVSPSPRWQDILSDMLNCLTSMSCCQQKSLQLPIIQSRRNGPASWRWQVRAEVRPLSASIWCKQLASAPGFQIYHRSRMRGCIQALAFTRPSIVMRNCWLHRVSRYGGNHFLPIAPICLVIHLFS